MSAKAKILTFIILALVIAGIVYYFDLTQYLNRSSLTTLVTGENKYAAALIFILLYIAVVVAFLPASIFSLAAGALFGTVLGSLYVIIGATIGATISFVLARYFIRDFVEEKMLTRFPSLARLDGAFKKRAWSLIFILRLAPIVPFNALNYFLGITKTTLTTYVTATLVGILPGVIAYVYFGEALSSLNPVSIGIALLVLIALAVISVLINKLTIEKGDGEYDIIVIGAGSGGLNIAGFMNRAGFKTLLIDKTDKNIGGDCLNFGCVPSKALLHVAKQIHEGKLAEQFGVSQSGAVDMKKVRDYVHSKREFIREHENADYFRKQGMDVVLGEATFAGKNKVSVAGDIYTAKKVILATGSRPFVPEIEGLENVNFHTNETIFDIETLPKKLLVIGGGPIGIELGQAFAMLGSEVRVVQRADKILEREDKEMTDVLHSKLQEQGITIHLESEVASFKDVHTAVMKTPEGEQEIAFDEVLFAVGRRLNTENLGLEKAGIEQLEHKKIKVNEYLETTNRRVLLCGDIAGQHQFTHAAELHAALIIKNFFVPKLLRKKLDTSHLSWVTYTDPALATFGMREKELQEKNISYEVLRSDFSHDDRAITDDYQYGLLKLFVAKDGTLLGGTMLAPNAGELIQELILVQSQGMKIDALFNKIYPYPTASRINKNTVAQKFKDKLTPTAKKLFRVLY